MFLVIYSGSAGVVIIPGLGDKTLIILYPMKYFLVGFILNLDASRGHHMSQSYIVGDHIFQKQEMIQQS